MTPSGIESAAFRFVAQHLNHCATAVLQLCTEESFVASVLVLNFYSLLPKISSLFVSHASSSIFGFHQYLKRCI